MNPLSFNVHAAPDLRAECQTLLERIPDSGLEETRAILQDLIDFYAEEYPRLIEPPLVPEDKPIRIAGRYIRPWW